MRASVVRRIVVVVWTFGGVLLLPAGAQAGFGSPITVTESGADPFGYPSDVGFDQSDTTTVETVSEGNILVYTRPPGGVFGGHVVGTGTKASMAVSADGAAVIVWRESATTVHVDYRLSSEGTFTAAASFSGSAVENVAAGIDASGNAVVAWKDGAIHYALSTGASFGPAQEAPLGPSPGFEGREGADPQRDHGPQAFRDNAGNVILAYRNGPEATVAHRAPDGTWDSTVLSGGTATDLQADADPTSGRLIVGYTTSGEFRAFEGSTSSSAGTIVVEQPASTSIMSVAMQRGGTVDAVFWSGASSELRSAGCLTGFAAETVAPSVGPGVVGAVTSGSDLVAYYSGGGGLGRASRVPGGEWTNTPFEVSNFGTLAVGAGYDGDALGLFVDYPEDTGITGFPYSGASTSSATCGIPLIVAPPSVTTPSPEAPKTESPPGPPTLAVSGNVAPVSGTVLVRLKGTPGFVPLSQVRQVPFGTAIEATHGRVSVTTAGPHGGTQTGEFFKGEFVLSQGRNGLVVATLTGGDFSVCPTARERSHTARASSKRASPKHVVRKLWANAHGSFSTKGNYAAGAVLGTEWLTEDLCQGTLIRVTRDKVKVTNLVRHRSVVVHAGHSYLAKA